MTKQQARQLAVDRHNKGLVVDVPAEYGDEVMRKGRTHQVGGEAEKPTKLRLNETGLIIKEG